MTELEAGDVLSLGLDHPVEDSISCPTLIQARFGERAVQKLRLALHHSTELAYNWWITSDDPVRAARRMLILLLPGDKVG